MKKKTEYIKPISQVFAVCAECEGGPAASGTSGGPEYGGPGSGSGGGGMNGAKEHVWSSLDDEDEI